MCQVILTVVGTVISGVIVFVFCQLIVQKYIKPYEDYKLLKGKVAFALVMYANLYSNPIKVTDERYMEIHRNERSQAQSDTRRLAAEVSAFQERSARYAPGIPSKQNFCEASSGLIQLSNSYFLTPGSDEYTQGKRNRECADKIRTALSIQTDPRRL